MQVFRLILMPALTVCVSDTRLTPVLAGRSRFFYDVLALVLRDKLLFHSLRCHFLASSCHVWLRHKFDSDPDEDSGVAPGLMQDQPLMAEDATEVFLLILRQDTTD